MAFGISSLGPCADAVGLSVMMVFCIGVAQLPVMIGLAMHVPSVRVDMYWSYMQVSTDPSTNRSAVIVPSAPPEAAAGVHYKHLHRQGEGSSTAILQVQASYMHDINISGLYVTCAAAFTFFVVMTMQFVDRGIRGDSGGDTAVGVELLMASFQEEYVAQNAALVGDPSFRLWNQAFVAAMLLLHFVACCTICSPVSAHMLLSASLLFSVSLGGMVQPLTTSSSSSQKAITLAGIYLAAVSLVLANIVADYFSAKAQATLLLAFLDCFMLFGHLWDRVPTLQVIVNCRLLYIVLLAAFNAGMLCLWDAYFRTPFVNLSTTSS